MAQKGAPKEVQPGVTEISSTAWLLRCLRSFRLVDDSGDGTLSADELRVALHNSGVQIEEHDVSHLFKKFDTDQDDEISFLEFCELAKLVRDKMSKSKSKSGRIPRLYLAPGQYEQYSAIFRERSGDDGLLDSSELQEFLTACNINISGDRLTSIMTEVDDDGSGTLDEIEFMVLLIKATAMKRRRVGPGLCELSQLKDEGWALVEMRRLGFEYRHFVEAGYDLASLQEIFAPSELRKAGVRLEDLLTEGWDCSKAREQGFGLQELHAAGVSTQRLRSAGFDDQGSATLLRSLGATAAEMRKGGWSASVLRKAGYGAADLRLAGFSAASLVALRQAALRESDGVLERISTPQMRAAAADPSGIRAN